MQAAQGIPSQGPRPGSPTRSFDSPVRAAPDQIPRTSDAMDGLAAKRAELNRQLEELSERREDLVDARDEIQTADRGPLDERIKLIDGRSLEIERELIVTDDAIAKGLANGIPWGPAGPPSGYVTGQSQTQDIRDAVSSATEDAVFGSMATGAFTMLGVYVLWRGFRRFVLRRKPVQPAIVDQTERLQRLEQSIDVIAIEMERVSEAQRFLTKTLTDRIPEIAAGNSASAKRGEEARR